MKASTIMAAEQRMQRRASTCRVLLSSRAQPVRRGLRGDGLGSCRDVGSGRVSVWIKVVRYREQEQLTILPSEEKKKIKRKKASLTWAALIRRVFEVDPLRCPCGGELKIVEFYTDGHECADYLERCGLPILTADPKPARSPPELENFEEPEFEDYVEPDTPDEWYGIDPPFFED